MGKGEKKTFEFSLKRIAKTSVMEFKEIYLTDEPNFFMLARCVNVAAGPRYATLIGPSMLNVPDITSLYIACSASLARGASTVIRKFTAPTTHPVSG